MILTSVEGQSGAGPGEDGRRTVSLPADAEPGRRRHGCRFEGYRSDYHLTLEQKEQNDITPVTYAPLKMPRGHRTNRWDFVCVQVLQKIQRKRRF